MRLADWLDDLAAASDTAAAAEDTYRRDFARRVAELAEARAVAFRRANLMRAVADGVAAAEDEETAVAHGLAILRTRLGWSSDSEARSEILSRFAPVCEAAFGAMAAAPPDFGAVPPPTPSGRSPSPYWAGDEAARSASPPPREQGDHAKHGEGGSPPPEQADPAAALAAFEAWYLSAKGTPFWLLFENVMPETPLVDW